MDLRRDVLGFILRFPQDRRIEQMELEAVISSSLESGGEGRQALPVVRDYAITVHWSPDDWSLDKIS